MNDNRPGTTTDIKKDFHISGVSIFRPIAAVSNLLLRYIVMYEKIYLTDYIPFVDIPTLSYKEKVKLYNLERNL